MEFVKKPHSSKGDRVINLKGLQKSNFPYIFIWIFYYAWVVSFATWWTASPLVENGFRVELRSLLHILNLISSVIFIFIFQKQWFVKTSRIGAVLVITGMGLFLLMPNTKVQLLSIVIIGISLGCINVNILMHFVFTLNNTEKLYAVIASNILINLISLFQGGNGGNYLQNIGDFVLLSIVL